MKIVAAIIIAIAMGAVVAGRTSDTSTASTQPGSPAVYAQIAADTDCVSLQNSFDMAERNGRAARNRGNLELAKATTSYMAAADERMRQIGCF